MYCQKCGQRIPDDSVFCPRCGQELIPPAVKGRLAELERRLQEVRDAVERLSREVGRSPLVQMPEAPPEAKEAVPPKEAEAPLRPPPKRTEAAERAPAVAHLPEVAPPPAEPPPAAPPPPPKLPRPPEVAPPPAEPPPAAPPPPPEPPRPPEERPRAAAFEVAYVQKVLGWPGLAALGVGVALFVLHTIATLGPWGKAGSGYALAIVMISLGLQLGRKYPRYGQLLTGGGAGLFYFMTYGIYFFQPIQIIHDQFVALLLLTVVAFCLIGYALRFRSEAIVASAFALGYIATNVGSITEFSLTALLVLTVVLALTAARRNWNVLLFGGIVATYGTHLRWMLAGAGGTVAWSDIAGSSSLLTGYFICYTLPGLWLPAEPREQVPGRLVGLVTLNGFLWTVLCAGSNNSYAPGTFGIVLFVSAAAHLVIAFASRYIHRGVDHYLVWAVAAVILTFAAIPIQFRGYAVPALWMVLAVLLLSIGILRNVPLCRWLGFTISGIANALFWGQLAYMGTSHEGWLQENGQLLAGLWLVIAGLSLRVLFLARTAKQPPSQEATLGHVISAITAVTAFALIYAEVSKPYLAFAWSLAAFAFILLSRKTADTGLRVSAFAGSVAVIVAYWATVATLGRVHWPDAWLPFLATSATLYLCSRACRAFPWLGQTRTHSYEAGVHSGMAGFALILLPGYRIPLAWLPLAWGLLGPALTYPLSVRIRDGGLRAAALLGGLLAVIALWTEMFQVPRHEFLERLWSEKWLPMLAVSIGWYVVRLCQRFWRRGAQTISEGEASAASLAAGLAIVTSLYSRVPAGFLPLSWVVTGAGLVAVGFVCFDSVMRSIGVFSSGLGVIVLLVSPASWRGLGAFGAEAGLAPWLSAVIAFAILYLTGRCYRFNQEERKAPVRWQKAYFSISAALCLWFGLSVAFPVEWLSVGWLLAGLIQVGLGLAFGDVYIRRFGLALFSLVVLKAFLVGFPSLGGVVRIVSFLALGGVLLAVSYCYYKYHDKIVKHL